MKWETVVEGRLCKIRSTEDGLLQVAVYDPHSADVVRHVMPHGSTLDEAKASALKLIADTGPLAADRRSRTRVVGRVKWFDRSKGYGFVNIADKEVFVHFSSILTDGAKILAERDDVEFEIYQGKRGPQALNLIRLDEADCDNYREMLVPRGDVVGVAMIDGVLRVVAAGRDGRWRFLDNFDHRHSLLYVWSNESRAYSLAVEELEALINDPKVKEQTIHEFFDRFPEFILTADYARAHSKVILTADDGNTLIPDFLLEPVGQVRLCDLLELKLPTVRVDVLQPHRLRFSAAVMEACAQLRTYRDFFEETANRQRFRDAYGLDVFRPRLFVIIGRRGRVDPIEWRRIETDLPAIHLRTYDDVLERAKEKLQRFGRLCPDDQFPIR